MIIIENTSPLDTEAVVLEEINNQLMQRTEIKVILKRAAGLLKRNDAIELMAKKNKTDIRNVIPIMMSCTRGNTDVLAKFHIYQDEDTIKHIVPRFRNLRTLSKADRKKIIDDEKAAKMKAKQALLEKSKSSK